MRYIFPILTCLTTLWMGIPLAWADSLEGKGDQLVARAVQSLADLPSVEAKVRQRATLFGKRASGAGFIVQLRDANRTLLRYEFKMQVGSQSIALLQVNDGTTLWLRRDMGQLKSQAYVNVRRIRQIQNETLSSRPPTADFSSPTLALGGLNEVLANISTHFNFGTPRAVEMLGLPMWEVVGQWNEGKVAKPLANGAVAAGDSGTKAPLSPHMPDTVKLLLGRDQKIPLFPYRIMFGRSQERDSKANGEAAADSLLDPLVTMELYEVRRRPDLTPADFAFQPSDENVEDLTDVYLEKLGLQPVAQ